MITVAVIDKLTPEMGKLEFDPLKTFFLLIFLIFTQISKRFLVTSQVIRKYKLLQ